MLLQIFNIKYFVVLQFFCIIPKNTKTLKHENTCVQQCIEFPFCAYLQGVWQQVLKREQVYREQISVYLVRHPKAGRNTHLKKQSIIGDP